MARRSGATSGFSHLISFDSEICGGSSDQLSFPSQPPDIRNWFSSYEYESPESPALPDDLVGSLLSQQDGSETQDPLAHVQNQKKGEDPQILKNKHWAQSPGIMPDEGSSVGADLVLLKENQSRELEVEGKSGTEYVGGTGSRTNGGSVDRQTQPQGRRPVKITREEYFSDQRDPRGNLKLATGGFASNAADEYPREGTMPKDGIVSIRHKDDMSAAVSGKVRDVLISRVDHEDMDADKAKQCDKMDNRLSRNGQNDGSHWNPKSSQGTGAFKMKKKRSLRQVLGEEFIGKCEEEKSDVIPRKTSTNSEYEEHLEGKDWRRDVQTKIEVGNEASEGKQSILVCSHLEQVRNAETSKSISTQSVEISRMDSAILPAGSVSTINCNDVEGKDELENEQVMSGDSTSRESSRHLAHKEQSQENTRHALSDKTNLQGLPPAAPVNPGKWRCPRKNKPYMGPSLKQLRMEQWLRRVN